MKWSWTTVFMIGIGFTVGLLCGLLVHLPAQRLPADSNFEGHHLARVRRVAQLEPSVDTSVDPADRAAAQYGDSDTQSQNQLGLILKGEANKQKGLTGDYQAISDRVENTGDKQYNAQIKTNLGALNKYPHRNSDSVVYVSPNEQKLILNNNVNNESESNRLRNPYAVDSKLGNDVIRDKLHEAGQLEEIFDRKSAQGYSDFNSDVKIDTQNLGSITSGNSPSVNGVYWSELVEKSCPKGFTKDDHQNWQAKSKSKFVKMSDGCGRMQNRMLVFQESGKACARYRLNVDQMQGELYSYYLSKLLGINNVPPSTLQLADTNQDQWRMIAKDVANAKWSEERPVILSKWIDGLSPSYIPVEFRNLSKVLLPKDVAGNDVYTQSDDVNSASSVCELLQWSDLIVFDYITANLDRVVNNLFNLQWNNRMMSKPAHNLERDSKGNIVFLDNESGLFHGYRLLDRYSTYHESLLKSVCVFRQGTIRSIRRLLETDSVGDKLQSLVEENETLHKYIPRIPMKNIKILKQRMGDVLKQVSKCESQS